MGMCFYQMELINLLYKTNEKMSLRGRSCSLPEAISRLEEEIASSGRFAHPPRKDMCKGSI